MATARQAAQRVRDIATDGIGWIAFWHKGRGWESSDFYVDYDEKAGRITLDHDDLPEIRKIIDEDPMAIFVNSYVHNLGVTDYQVSTDNLAHALKWQYSMQNSLLIDAI